MAGHSHTPSSERSITPPQGRLNVRWTPQGTAAPAKCEFKLLPCSLPCSYGPRDACMLLITALTLGICSEQSCKQVAFDPPAACRRCSASPVPRPKKKRQPFCSDTPLQSPPPKRKCGPQPKPVPAPVRAAYNARLNGLQGRSAADLYVSNPARLFFSLACGVHVQLMSVRAACNQAQDQPESFCLPCRICNEQRNKGVPASEPELSVRRVAQRQMGKADLRGGVVAEVRWAQTVGQCPPVPALQASTLSFLLRAGNHRHASKHATPINLSIAPAAGPSPRPRRIRAG